MIDRQKFTTWWQMLEARFGQRQTAEAAQYLRYLDSQGMNTKTFEDAAGAVWATSRFFPRPADFLLVEAGVGWTAVLMNAPTLIPQAGRSRSEWDDARKAIPERAFRALMSIGGPLAMSASKDLAHFRREFLNAYELVVVEDSKGALELVAPRHPAALASGL